MQECEARIQAALSKALEVRGAQTRISNAIGVTGSTVMRWGNGEVSIPEPMQKLLRLYLFGEVPFEEIRDVNDARTILEFTPSEWQLITILAARAGQEPSSWIRSQILAYLAYQGGNQTGSVAALNPLRSLDKMAEEGKDYRIASNVPPGTSSRTGND